MNFPDSLVRQRSTEPDEYGNAGKGWTSPDELPFQGFLQPATARRKDWAAYCPAGTDAQPGDRVKRGAERYDVRTVKDIRTPLGVVKMRQLDLVRIPDV